MLEVVVCRLGGCSFRYDPARRQLSIRDADGSAMAHGLVASPAEALAIAFRDLHGADGARGALLSAAVACAALVPVSCWLGSPFFTRVLVAGLGIGLWARARGMSGHGEEDVLVRATLAVDGDEATLGLPASVGAGAKGRASLEPTGDLVVGGRRVTPASVEARESVRRLLGDETGL